MKPNHLLRPPYLYVLYTYCNSHRFSIRRAPTTLLNDSLKLKEKPVKDILFIFLKLPKKEKRERNISHRLSSSCRWQLLCVPVRKGRPQQRRPEWRISFLLSLSRVFSLWNCSPRPSLFARPQKAIPPSFSCRSLLCVFYLGFFKRVSSDMNVTDKFHKY